MKQKDKNGALTDEERAHFYEQKDPQLAEWLRVPEKQRTREILHAIAARVTYWNYREAAPKL
jgi:hypothetical protein